MDYGLALKQKYPNIDKSQYELMVDAAGNFSITKWNVAGTPKPSITDLENYYNTNMLDYFKTQKKSELQAQRDTAVYSGFTSSALGTSHQYLSDPTSMAYYMATMLRFTNDPTFSSINWWTIDAGYLAHTKAQFIQLFNDAHQFGLDQDEQLAKLNADVDAAKTPDAINAITW